MTNTNPASTLAADLLRYADLIEDELVAGRPRKMGDAADCASPIMRQAAAALRASTPSAAPVAVGEAVLKVEDGVIVWAKLPKGADALLYAHPPTAQAAERQPLTGWLPIETAPKVVGRILGSVEGRARFICWGKASHVPMYGWVLTDQGAEDCDLCQPDGWMELPAGIPASGEAKSHE